MSLVALIPLPQVDEQKNDHDSTATRASTYADSRAAAAVLWRRRQGR